MYNLNSLRAIHVFTFYLTLITFNLLVGDCVTSVFPGDVCGLNSVTSTCSNLTATTCTCREGYEAVDQITCIGKVLRFVFRMCWLSKLRLVVSGSYVWILPRHGSYVRNLIILWHSLHVISILPGCLYKIWQQQYKNMTINLNCFQSIIWHLLQILMSVWRMFVLRIACVLICLEVSLALVILVL